MMYPDERPDEAGFRPPPELVRTYQTEPVKDERSLADLFSELTQETQTLVRQEIEMARVEASNKAKKAGKHVGYVAAGGFIAYAGFIILLMALGFLLDPLLTLPVAFLVVGLLAAGAGYILLQSGLTELKKQSYSLDRTAATIKEDKQWIKEEI